MDGKKKAALIFGLSEPEDDKETEGSEDEGSEDRIMAAEEVLSAIEAKDAEALADAVEALVALSK